MTMQMIQAGQGMGAVRELINGNMSTLDGRSIDQVGDIASFLATMEAGRPWCLANGADLTVTMTIDGATDTERYGALRRYLDHVANRKVGAGALWLSVPIGLWGVRGGYDWPRSAGMLRLRSQAYWPHTINGITYTRLGAETVAPYHYEALVSLTAALNPAVVVGWTVSAHFISGDGDAGALTGAHRVTWISEDRLSCKVQFMSPVLLESPTAITTGNAYSGGISLGMINSQLRVPFGVLDVSGADLGSVGADKMDGSAREGFLNFSGAGSGLICDDFALGYSGPSGSGCLIKVADEAALDALDSHWSGGPERGPRGANGATLKLNRVGIGGALTAREGVSHQEGGKLQLQRCSIRAHNTAVVCGARVDLTFNSSAIGASSLGLYALDDGGGLAKVGRVDSCGTALRVSSATVTTSAGLTMRRCAIGVDPLKGGRCIDPVTMIEVTTASSVVPNMIAVDGSAWLDATQAPARYVRRLASGAWPDVSVNPGARATYDVTAADGGLALACTDEGWTASVSYTGDDLPAGLILTWQVKTNAVRLTLTNFGATAQQSGLRAYTINLERRR